MQGRKTLVSKRYIFVAVAFVVAVAVVVVVVAAAIVVLVILFGGLQWGFPGRS